MKRLAPLLLVALPVGAAVSVACSDSIPGPWDVEEIVVINQNILHGLIDEDPDAEPYDRFPERMELFADAVGEEQPDVLLMQEVVGSPEDPNYPDPRRIVLDALGSEYEAVFGNFLGGPIDDPGLGQMTFTRLPIIKSENRSVSQIRSVVHLALQAEYGVVDVYNAHLEGGGAVLETGDELSVEEMDAVIAFINETRDGEGSVILAGDLNATPDSPSIQRLVDAGFHDAFRGRATCDNPGDSGCTNSEIPLADSPERTSDHRIDYVFVKSGGRVIDVKDAQLFLDDPIELDSGGLLQVSDHIGLIVRLEIKTVEG